MHVGVVGVVAFAWILYWSLSLRGATGAAALLVLVALIVYAANLSSPTSWASPWTRGQALGAFGVFVFAALLAVANILRAEKADPPFLNVEQVPSFVWLLAAVALLLGAYGLLATGARAGPACAICGAAAESTRCSRCGSSLVDSGEA